MFDYSLFLASGLIHDFGKYQWVVWENSVKLSSRGGGGINITLVVLVVKP